MLIIPGLLVILGPIAGLVYACRHRSLAALRMLNVFWWLGSMLSGYYVLLAWLDRRYSENWAMLGVIFFSLPYILVTAPLLAAELAATRKWPPGGVRAVRLSSLALLVFLVFQAVTGILSCR